MQYEFRPNLFQKKLNLELVGNTIRITDHKDRLRSVEVDDIKMIRLYGAGPGLDPDAGAITIYHCILILKHGKPIKIHSASYLGPDKGARIAATDHRDEYFQFVQTVKEKLVKFSPDVPVVHGHRTASICWGIVFLIGLGVIGLFIFGAISEPGKIWEIWPIIIPLLMIGLIVVPMAYKLAFAYVPEKMSLSQSLSDST